jgi:cytochrome b pre-mRNA-processing protein 3
MLNDLLTRLFRRAESPADNTEAIAERLYDAAVAQARQPVFYARCGVPDTVDGRFDMVVLHVCLLIRRLGRGGDSGQALAQVLFDTTFRDMDRSLREMGVGDLGVARRVKEMARAYYGRAEAYDQALDAGDADRLGEALRRNLLAGAGEDAQVRSLADYVTRADAALATISDPDMLAGDAAFEALPEWRP